jgi:hypothetical protein
VDEIWKKFLQKERLKKRIFLSSSVNTFLEKLVLHHIEKEHQTPFVIVHYMYFDTICLERKTAVRTHFTTEDNEPFVTWRAKEENEKLQPFLNLTNEEKKIVDQLLNEFLRENSSFFAQKK